MSGQVRYLYRVNSVDQRSRGRCCLFNRRRPRCFACRPGRRRAHVRVDSLNRDLYGAGAPPATLSLRVGSPFWKRWWFYALALGVMGLALGAIFAAHRLREREYVLPKELREYVPIEPNPYLVGNPIRTEQMFYGREDDFRYVRTKLEGVSQGVVIVFCGERRAGKSSILYQVLNGRLGRALHSCLRRYAGDGYRFGFGILRAHIPVDSRSRCTRTVKSPHGARRRIDTVPGAARRAAAVAA